MVALLLFRPSSESGRAGGGATATESSFPARVLDQNPSHGLGRSGEEVAPIVPPLWLIDVDQAEICLVDERCGLQRLSGLLLDHFLSGQLPQFVVD